MKIKSFALILFGAAALAACTGKGDSDAAQGTPKFETPIDSLSYALGMGYSASQEEMGMVLTNAGSDKAFVDQLLQGVKDGINGGDKAKLAYYVGLQAGMNMRRDIIAEAEARLFGMDSLRHLNLDNFLAGFEDVVNKNFHFKVNGEILLPDMAANYVQTAIEKVNLERACREYRKEFEASKAFWAAKVKEPGVDSLESGIYYKVIQPGKGPKPSEQNIVSIEYEGRLTDGTVITKSHAITDVAVRNGIIDIPGFTIVMTNMPLNAEWEAYIPWSLAYGTEGYSDAIPPFSDLIFRIKLHNIK
jgi:FKBP-type peptidyl-prolyl cis-trans isomerase